MRKKSRNVLVVVSIIMLLALLVTYSLGAKQTSDRLLELHNGGKRVDGWRCSDTQKYIDSSVPCEKIQCEINGGVSC